MNIVLTGADFSACGIGQIEVNVPRSGEATVIATKYGSISDTNKTALMDFIDTLKYSGVYSKIKLMMFPILGSTLEESTMNIMNDSTEDYSAVCTKTEYGISFNSGVIMDLTEAVSGTFDGSELSMGVIIKPNISTTNITERLIHTGGTMANTPRMFVQHLNDIYSIKKGYHDPSTNVDSLSANILTDESLASSLMSISAANNIAYTLTDTKEISSVVVAGTSLIPGTGLYISSAITENGYNINFSGELAFAFYGDYLTDEQIEIMGTAMDDFKDALVI